MSLYKKIKVLGEGAYGKAVLVKISNNEQMKNRNQISVLKISNKKSTESTESTEANTDIIKEIMLIRGLRQNEHIIKLKSVFKENNQYVMELERMDGTLDSKGDFDTFQSNLKQIVEGLRYLHLCGFSHNDLKPHNILQRKDKVKLADFGLSVFHGLPNENNENCNGTAMFVSPECSDNYLYARKYSADGADGADGADENKEPEMPEMPIISSLLSDVWSVGVLIYDFVYRKIYDEFPWDWAKSYAIYHLQYEDGDMPVGWKTFISKTTGEPYYSITTETGEFVTWDAPLKVSQIVEHIGEVGFRLMKSCMNVNVNLRPSMSEILEHDFFKKDTTTKSYDTGNLFEQVGGLLSRDNMKNYIEGNMVNDLKYFRESKKFMRKQTYEITAGRKQTLGVSADLAYWFLAVNIYLKLKPEVLMMTGYLLNKYLDIFEESKPKGVSYACMYLSCILYDTPVDIKDLIYLADFAYTEEQLMRFINKLILNVIMNDEIDFTVIPRLQYLSLYCLELIKLHDKLDPDFVNHTLYIAFYMAFCATEIITDQNEFCKIVIASTIIDLGVPIISKYWMFPGSEHKDYGKYKSSNRHPKYKLKYINY